MANYLLVYHGGKMPESPEEGAQVPAIQRTLREKPAQVFECPDWFDSFALKTSPLDPLTAF